MEIGISRKIDVTSTRYTKLRVYELETKLIRLNCMPRWGTGSVKRVDCPCCNRGGPAKEFYEVIRELNRGRGNVTFVYWDSKAKDFVCPFCQEGLMVRSKIETA